MNVYNRLSFLLPVGLVGMVRIVDGVVQAAAFLALHGLLRDEVAHVDHVAQFAQLAGGLAALEEAFGLLVEDVQAVPGAGEAHVAAHDAHVRLHNLVHLLHALRDEHAFLVADGALVVPFGDVFVEVVALQHA